MARLVKDSQERECTYVRIAESDIIKESQFEYAKLYGFDIRYIRIGYEKVRVMLIPTDAFDEEGQMDETTVKERQQEIHDALFHADDNWQKKQKTIEKYEGTSIEDAVERLGDCCEELQKNTVEIVGDADKFDIAADIILKEMKEFLPEKYEQYRLQLEEYTRTEVAEILDASKSTVYKPSATARKIVNKVLDELWCLNI